MEFKKKDNLLKLSQEKDLSSLSLSKDTDKKNFKEFLKSKKLKFTKERDALINFILHMTQHFDVESLELLLKENQIETSRATIYRTLDLLVEAKLVNKVNFENNRYYYEYSSEKKKHYHLICKICLDVIEFFSDLVENLYKQICKKYDFQPIEHNFKIFGICRNCQKPIEKDREK